MGVFLFSGIYQQEPLDMVPCEPDYHPRGLDSIGVLLKVWMAMGGEGWLADPYDYWVKRIHRDSKTPDAVGFFYFFLHIC